MSSPPRRPLSPGGGPPGSNTNVVLSWVDGMVIVLSIVAVSMYVSELLMWEEVDPPGGCSSNSPVCCILLL